MNLINELKNDANGAAVLADWLGNGGTPVCQDTADRRARACLEGSGGECPRLTHPRWWESAKGAVAFAIKEQLEAKSGLKLETKLDANPRLCNVCGCCASLKAWVPIAHIASHTPDDLVNKFPPHCWIRQEIENL